MLDWSQAWSVQQIIFIVQKWEAYLRWCHFSLKARQSFFNSVMMRNERAKREFGLLKFWVCFCKKMGRKKISFHQYFSEKRTTSQDKVSVYSTWSWKHFKHLILNFWVGLNIRFMVKQSDKAKSCDINTVLLLVASNVILSYTEITCSTKKTTNKNSKLNCSGVKCEQRWGRFSEQQMGLLCHHFSIVILFTFSMYFSSHWVSFYFKSIKVSAFSAVVFVWIHTDTQKYMHTKTQTCAHQRESEQV